MENCGVCLQPCTETGDHTPAKLQCGHTLGRNCMVEWFRIQQLCPFCRVAVSPVDLFGPGTAVPNLAEKVREIVSNANEVVSSSCSIIRSSSDVSQKVKLVAAKSPIKCSKTREDAISKLDEVSRGFLGLWEQLCPVISDMDSVLYICSDDGRVEKAVVDEYTQARKQLEHIVFRLTAQQAFMARLYKKLRTVEGAGKRIAKNRISGH